MIRLEPCPIPAQLTEEKQDELTAEYKRNKKKRVWRKSYIEQALLKMSHNKCCYCECKLGEESKYLEVDHFFPKDIYPDKVVEWENLLPSCKRCNTKKGSHDTGKEPIIHPVKDGPREHLYLKNYQIRAKNDSLLGETTIGILDLNDSARLTIKRLDIGEKLSQRLSILNALAVKCFKNGCLSNEDKDRLFKGVKALLGECIPTAEYGATAAAVLLEDEFYISIRKKFIENGLWDDELEELENKAKECALDTVRT